MGSKHRNYNAHKRRADYAVARPKWSDDDLADFMRRQLIRVHHAADKSIARVERVRRKAVAESSELVRDRDVALGLIEVRVRR